MKIIYNNNNIVSRAILMIVLLLREDLQTSIATIFQLLQLYLQRMSTAFSA